MYDTAKRGMAFAVATSGLLLTGTGYAAAADVTSVGAIHQYPAIAHNSAGADRAEQSQAVAFKKAQKPAAGEARSALSHEGAPGGAWSETTSSGGVVAWNTVQAPINVPINLCGNEVVALALGGAFTGASCSTGSGGPAPAVAMARHAGGVVAGNTVQAPINVPINLCGNDVLALVLGDTFTGASCSTGSGGAAHAAAVTHHSGGVVAGNTVQAPIDVPVNICGNVVAIGSLITGSQANCSANEPTPIPTPTTSAQGIPTPKPTCHPTTVPTTVPPAATPSASPTKPCGCHHTPPPTPSASASTLPPAGTPSASPSKPCHPTPSASTTLPPAGTPSAKPSPSASPTKPCSCHPTPSASATLPPAGTPSAKPSPSASKTMTATATATPVNPAGLPTITASEPAVVWPMPSESEMSDHHSDHHDDGSESGGQQLAHTGADELGILGTGAMALAAGVGLRTVSRRHRR